MELGMLWFDNNPNTEINAKVRSAADYYRKKFGRLPNLCLVNPSALSKEIVTDERITVQPYRSVLPGHLWIGIKEAKAII